jgi:hypothetical protein
LLLNANSAIFQVFHGEEKLIVNEKMEFDSNSSLKQQSADMHVALLAQIIPIPSQSVFVLSP